MIVNIPTSLSRLNNLGVDQQLGRGELHRYCFWLNSTISLDVKRHCLASCTCRSCRQNVRRRSSRQPLRHGDEMLRSQRDAHLMTSPAVVIIRPGERAPASY